MEELVNIRARAAREEAEALRAFINAEVARVVRAAMRDLPAQVSGDVDRLMTVREAAHFLNVKERTIYEWVTAKKIPHRHAGNALRFIRSELLAWTSGEQSAMIVEEKRGAKLHALKAG